MQTIQLSNRVVDLCLKKAASEEDLTEVPGHLLPGRGAAKNSALQAYQEGFTALRNDLAKVAYVIVVTGKEAGPVLNAAREDKSVVALDGDEMYRAIAEEWYPTVRVDKTFALDSLPVFLGAIGKRLRAIGVAGIASPEFKSAFGQPVRNLTDATAITRNILLEAAGADLNALFLTHRLTEEVLAAEWEKEFVPVVLTLSEKEAADSRAFFEGKCVVLDTDIGIEGNTKDWLASAFAALVEKFGLASRKKKKAPASEQTSTGTPNPDNQ